jgi:2-methylcitrate dehydratase PrpD
MTGKRQKNPLEGLTMRLATYVGELNFSDIPSSVVDKASLHLRDGLGNQIAASAISEAPRLMIELVREWGGVEQSTIVGHGIKRPAPMAAMCNAMLGHGVELDDAHGPGLIKAGSVIVPSAMAVGEHVKASGKDVLVALIAGYDVAIRIAGAPLRAG